MINDEIFIGLAIFFAGIWISEALSEVLKERKKGK